MITTHEQQQENLKIWVAALRSGEYKQGRERLRYEDEFCCLGVACDLSDPTGWDKMLYGEYEYDGKSNYMPDDVRTTYGLEAADQHELGSLNDKGMDFPAIADHIEKHYIS